MKDEGGVTSCIGFTFTARSAGPGCASQVLIDSSRSPAFATLCPQKPHPLRDLAEVRALQVRVHRYQAGRFLLYIDKSELAVFINGDLDRQLLLHDGQQIAEQHGEPA